MLVCCDWCSKRFDISTLGVHEEAGRTYCSEKCKHEHKQALNETAPPGELREG